MDKIESWEKMENNRILGKKKKRVESKKKKKINDPGKQGEENEEASKKKDVGTGRQKRISRRKNKKESAVKRIFFRKNSERKKRRKEMRSSRFRKIRKSLHDRFSQLKWRFGLYVPLCIILAFAGSLVIGNVMNYLQDWCIEQYGLKEGELEYYYEYWYSMGAELSYSYRGIEGDMERLNMIYNIISLLQLFLIPTWILFSVYLTGRIFYSRELKTPINLLLDASRRIADNQLDFKLEYNKQNEFGMLCRAFDEMRAALYDSNRQLWRSLEERKRLNAAFSHDLRTPLTVLRGYADFLEKYIPNGNVSNEKLLEVLGMMSGQIVRLEHYTQTMNSVQKLGDIVPNPGLAAAEQIKNSFRRTGEMLCGTKTFTLEWRGEGLLRFDVELVFQIYENLVSNACRYAKNRVMVKCAVEKGMFVFVVADDGKGFRAEALRSASEPFFRDEREPDKMHFGMGLYICRILCEKCGGMLKIGNIVDKEGGVHGGKVTAIVKCEM